MGFGANNGRFSRIAVECGAETVVAWDIDPACVDQNYRQMIQHARNRDSPAVARPHEPRSRHRLGKPRTLFICRPRRRRRRVGLGLIHHLAVSNNVPLAHIASCFARLGKWLIVEWIPKDDSQFQRLLNSRADIFTDYGQQQFESQFRQYFSLQRTEPLENSKRSLYLMSPIEDELR